MPGHCSLVMPLVCKDMVDILDVGVNSTSANHTSLSNFAFLYGVFPTAPSVAIYAGHYNMELEVVSRYTQCFGVTLVCFVLLNASLASFRSHLEWSSAHFCPHRLCMCHPGC